MKKLGKYRVKVRSPSPLAFSTTGSIPSENGEREKFERLSPREISRRQKSTSVKSTLNRTTSIRTSSVIPFQSRNTRNRDYQTFQNRFEMQGWSRAKAHLKLEHSHRVLIAENQLDVGVFFAINLWIWCRCENDRFVNIRIHLSHDFCHYFWLNF